MIRTSVRSKKKNKTNYDSLVVEIPKDFALKHGLPIRSLATLTVDKNGKITSEIIGYDETDEKSLADFLKDFPDLDGGMKAVGD